MRATIHLLDVAEPLLSYHGLQMRCGVVLHTAVPRFMESDELPDTMRPSSIAVSGICHKCRKAIPVGDSRRQYTYGLVEAELAKQEESID